MRAPKVEALTVEVEVANYDDVMMARSGYLDPANVRRKTIQGIVDLREPRFVLPKSVVESLGLRENGKVRVEYPDGTNVIRVRVEGAYLEFLGRNGTFNATVVDDSKTAVIGRIVLNDLDLLIDKKKSCVKPRDQRFVVCDL